MSPRPSPALAAAAHTVLPPASDPGAEGRAGRRADLLAAVLDVLGGPALSWVRQQVRGRLEDDDAPLTGVLQHLTATPAQRAAALELLGPSAVRGTRIAVRVEDLEQLLAELAGWSAGLAAAVRALDGGPVELDDDEPDEPDEPDEADAPSQAGEPALAVPPSAPAVVVGPPPAAAPAVPVPAPVTAPVAVPPEPVRELDDAAADAAGLELTDVVLALALPVEPGSAPAIAAASAAGQPVVVTLHQLQRTPPRWRSAPPGGVVFVCATPSVVAAVAVAGAPPAGRAPVPVVCLDAAATSGGADPGWPGDAVVMLLEQLRASGWTLRLNGGGGPEGAVLTELLAAELDAVPWRAPDAEPDTADPLAAARPGVPLLRQLVADVRGA